MAFLNYIPIKHLPESRWTSLLARNVMAVLGMCSWDFWKPDFLFWPLLHKRSNQVPLSVFQADLIKRSIHPYGQSGVNGFLYLWSDLVAKKSKAIQPFTLGGLDQRAVRFMDSGVHLLLITHWVEEALSVSALQSLSKHRLLICPLCSDQRTDSLMVKMESTQCESGLGLLKMLAGEWGWYYPFQSV